MSGYSQDTSRALESRVLWSEEPSTAVTPTLSRWLFCHPDLALGMSIFQTLFHHESKTNRVPAERKGSMGDHWIRSKPGKQPGKETTKDRTWIYSGAVLLPISYCTALCFLHPEKSQTSDGLPPTLSGIG